MHTGPQCPQPLAFCCLPFSLALPAIYGDDLKPSVLHYFRNFAKAKALQ
jgi:hypothetical protein